MDRSQPESTDKERVEVFCCYARRDQAWLFELQTHLAPLQREGLITLWDDTQIYPGEDWKQEIHHHLDTAQIILLLVSPHFLSSDYCYTVEMQRAMDRHEHGEARVIPIILHPVSWEKTPFRKLQALPPQAKPITGGSWHHPNEAFLTVVEGIRKVVKQPGRKSVERDLSERKVVQARSRYRMNYSLWLSVFPLLLGFFSGVLLDRLPSLAFMSTMQASYTYPPPLVPVMLSIDPDGQISIKGTSNVTLIGTFSTGTPDADCPSPIQKNKNMILDIRHRYGDHIVDTWYAVNNGKNNTNAFIVDGPVFTEICKHTILIDASQRTISQIKIF